MAIIKCKMCGGDIELAADKTFGTCEFCGSTMTLPKVDDDQRAAAFNRGNHFRRIGEFDKALAVYERIVREDDTDAEAHWCCALCRFGIEYVEDPATYEYLPTCHRASFDSFLEDVDYLAAVEHSEGITKRQYQKDAAKIAEVQRGILATSQNEEPFDVFICYKESDENGERTRDSLMAQDVYYQLTDQGYRVFFARITLEDMVGKQYEPYIFAALNSAKVMIVIGTRPEYMNAVWVKNEWSRFLAMMKKDRHKLLLPCYRDMDPYDMPEQLSVLQSYDMAKIGFIQDLIRGINKVLDVEKKPAPAKETVVVQQTSAASTAPLLQRAFMFLEDGDWNSADEYCEKVLDLEPQNAMAYVGKLMAELKVRKQENLKDQAAPFDGSNHYQKAVRFANEELKATLTGYIEHINTRNENARLDGIYCKAKKAMVAATTEKAYKEAARSFESISEYLDAAALAQACHENADVARKNAILSEGKAKMTDDSIASYESAIKLFKSIPGWRDADEKLNACRKKIEEIKAKAEAERLEKERQAEIVRQEAERRSKRNKKIASITAAVACAIIAVIILVNTVIIPIYKYNEAVSLMEAGEYKEAAIAFGKARNYKDAKASAKSAWDKIASRDTIGVGANHIAGLKDDGTVVAVGSDFDGQTDVGSWTDIVAISVGQDYTVGLKTDGTVVAVGENVFGQCDIGKWKNIVAISAGAYHTVGLKADGTVVTVGDNGYGQCDVGAWSDIVAISAGSFYTVGLKADGTVVAVGMNTFGYCNVGAWRDIVAISAGVDNTVGLKADGTVVVVGSQNNGQHNVKDWTNMKVPK